MTITEQLKIKFKLKNNVLILVYFISSKDDYFPIKATGNCQIKSVR